MLIESKFFYIVSIEMFNERYQWNDHAFFSKCIEKLITEMNENAIIKRMFSRKLISFYVNAIN